MKKTLITMAACGVLLFAACEKGNKGYYTIEGDRITFDIAADAPNEGDKRAFSGEMKRIFFTTGDQMYVNGEVCNLYPFATVIGGNSSFSPGARVSATLSADGSYEFVFPATDVAPDAAGAYWAELPKNVIGVNGAQRRNDFCSDGTYDAPVWPLYYKVSDLDEEDDVVLRSACAFISPLINYGPNWSRKVFRPITGGDYGAPVTNDSVVPSPVINVENGWIFSDGMDLCGEGIINVADPAYPIFQTVNSTESNRCIAFRAPANTTVIDNVVNATGQEVRNVVGIIPVPPAENNAVKKFKIYVNANVTLNGTTYYMTYITKWKGREDVPVVVWRNHRYFLGMNWETLKVNEMPDNACYAAGSAEAYVAAISTTTGGKLEFAGGDLYVYDSKANRDNAPYLPTME